MVVTPGGRKRDVGRQHDMDAGGGRAQNATTCAEGDMTVHANAKNLLKGATGDWEVVIGLEVHAQVTSKAKLFSGAATAFGAEPNAQVSLVDAAMPGVLPVRPQELLLRRPAAGLPDQPALPPAGRRRRADDRGRREGGHSGGQAH